MPCTTCPTRTSAPWSPGPRWLRPGGRIVIGDMMFGRGMSPRDRAILRQKAAALAAKGPGGLWRIAKNLTRYGLRVGQEHPAPPEFWLAAPRDAGLVDVVFRPVVAEAGLVRGIRPDEAGRTGRELTGQELTGRAPTCIFIDT